MRKILTCLMFAAGLGLAASASAAPISGAFSSAAPAATLLTPAQYCRCGRICYSRDYYGRCIGWRCRACGYRYYHRY